MKKLKKIETTYPLVFSPIEANSDGCFSTLNFDMFIILKYNRGEDNSIDPVRLSRFEKILRKNEYFKDDVHLVVNKRMEVIDGTHRLTLHRKYGIPVNFRITKVKELNSDNYVQLMGAVARFNALTSKWDGKAHFDVALKTKQPVAIKIDKLKADIDSKFNLNKQTLTQGRLFSLATQDKKGLESRLVTVEEYAQDEVIKAMSTPEFDKQINFVGELLSMMEEWNVIYKDSAKLTMFYLFRVAMPLIWDNELNMDKFINEIKNKDLNVRFKNVANTKHGFKVFVLNIQKKLLGIK